MKLLNINKSIFFIIFAWLIITSININKSFHIDDTAYLEIAKWIESNPLNPMSAEVNWGDKLQVNWEDKNINKWQSFHPPLFMYLIAFWGKIFSYDEVSLHILLSIFTFWVIFRFYSISKLLDKKDPIFLTLILCISPALVMGQNLMLDIPLMAIWFEFLFCILNFKYTEGKKFFLASFLFSIGMLLKYSTILLFPILLYKILISKKKIFNLIWLSIPILVLLLWSLFNIYDFGGIHFLQMPQKTIWLYKYFESSIGFIVTMGAVSPFVSIMILNIYLDNSKKKIQLILIFIMTLSLLSALTTVMTYFVNLNTGFVNKFLYFLFFFNGLIIVIYFLIFTLKKIKIFNIHSDDIIFIYLIVSIPIFVVLFAPFVASRHVLLVLPFLILFFSENLILRSKAKIIISFFFIIFSLSTIIYSISDSNLSKIYKIYASKISKELTGENNVWFKGHWGWQWYAKKNGMKHLININEIKNGDYLVIPNNVSGSSLPELDLSLVKKYTIEKKLKYQNFSTLFFYSYFNFYNMNIKQKFYSNEPIEIFSIYQLKK
tara:strand:- start:720 stop:2357 length:1638 start_codon:yes stop_codon:yes gene_type:complete